jgi:hypothetical protein
MSTAPFAISWKSVRGDDPKEGKITIYAISRDHANHLFCQSHPIGSRPGVIVTDMELDVKRGELDLAILVAHRARQRWKLYRDAAKEVREILAACKINLEDVLPELQRLDLPGP